MEACTYAQKVSVGTMLARVDEDTYWLDVATQIRIRSYDKSGKMEPFVAYMGRVAG
jgi:hypothetical protein